MKAGESWPLQRSFGIDARGKDVGAIAVEANTDSDSSGSKAKNEVQLASVKVCTSKEGSGVATGDAGKSCGFTAPQNSK